MGGISSRLPLKWIAAVIALLVVAFVWIKLNQSSKVESPTTGLQESAQTGAVIPGQEESDFGRTGLEGDRPENRSWIASSERALNNEEVSQRIQAVLDLRKHPGAEAVHLLANFLNDKAAVVVSEAIDSLGFIGLNSDRGDAVYEILEEKAKDKGFALRGQALITAAMLGKDRLLPVVSDFIYDENDSGRDSAVRALALIASPACVHYIDVLLHKSDDTEVRRNSFNALAKIDSPEALGLLQKHMASSNDEDQAASALALSSLNRPEVNQILADAIQGNQLETGTIRALARSPAAASIFGDLLQREGVEKAKKASLLKTIAKHSTSYGSMERRTELKEAVEPLLNSSDPMIQKEAIRAISGIGAEGTDVALMSKLDSKDPNIRQETVSSLVGYVTPTNYKELLPVIWDDDQETRRIAFMCVQQFLGESDREILEKAKSHPDELIRKQVPMLLEQVLGQ
ncbi:MAG: HEAT repeat domain-containing protein [Thermodesulfobacteriota bacterium]|nr:HEAT repeat domain-containing protein [Thermodesulfobacteriota bacterium]